MSMHSQICYIAPPGLGKTWVSKTGWGRKHVIDTDHAIKLINDELPTDKGGREQWVIDAAINLVAVATRTRASRGPVVIVSNLHHVFDHTEMFVVIPKHMPDYLSALRLNRDDLSRFTDETLTGWIGSYRDFAYRNSLNVIEVDGFMSSVPAIAEAIANFESKT